MLVIHLLKNLVTASATIVLLRGTELGCDHWVLSKGLSNSRGLQDDTRVSLPHSDLKFYTVVIDAEETA